MQNFWIQTPSDTSLSEMQGWAQLGGNKFAAIRHHLLVVSGRDGKGRAKNGPVHRQMEWPVKAKFRMENKVTKVTKYTYSIQESITSTVTAKLTQEVLSKVGASAGVSLTKLEATLASEVQAKIGTELVEALQGALAITSTYSVETTIENLRAIEFEVSEKDGTRPLFVYVKLRQQYWDVYLYRTEYLQLEYEKSWLWPNVRRTIIHKVANLRKPLFRIAYFEPEEDLSYRFDDYEPEIENGDSVTSSPLDSPCPALALEPKISMEELARIAFPVSKKEKEAAKKKKASLRKPSQRASAAKKSTAGASRKATAPVRRSFSAAKGRPSGKKR